jgi:hypothetical protein
MRLVGRRIETPNACQPHQYIMDRLNEDPSILKFNDVSLESYPESLHMPHRLWRTILHWTIYCKSQLRFHSVHMHRDESMIGRSKFYKVSQCRIQAGARKSK